MFRSGQSDECECLPQWTFDLHFFESLVMLSIFSCAHMLSVGFPQRNNHFDPWPIFFFFLVCMYFWYWAAGAVCMFWRWIPCGSLPLKTFLPILRAVFVFPWGFPFGMQKLLSLIQSHFLICDIFFIFLRGRSTKNLLHSCQIVFCLYFFSRIS